MDKQTFSLNSDLLGGYTGIFIKVVILIILIYGFVLIINLLRDKFIKKDTISKDPQITDILTILNKLFYLTGYGFIIGNLMQKAFSAIGRSRHSFNLQGEWDYLTFGIILIFIGIGFKAAKKVILKDNQE